MSFKNRRSWKLARRIDELELVLARLHQTCAEQLALRSRRVQIRNLSGKRRKEARRTA